MDIKQEIGIKVKFILEIKFQKHICQQNVSIFWAANASFLNPC